MNYQDTEELNVLERDVFSALWSRADNDKRALTSPEEIGQELRMGRETVVRTTRRLRQGGWLRQSSRRVGPDKKTSYILLRPLPESDVVQVSNSVHPTSSQQMVVYPGLEVNQETITPTRARELLATNLPLNRAIKDHKLEQYAAAMSQGVWPLTTETIKIDRFGRLIDGQHRLFACVQADVPFETLVAYGVSEEAIDYIDQGATRTMGDAISFHGIKNPADLVTISRTLLAWRDDVLLNKNMMYRVTTQPNMLSFVIANEAEVREAMKRALKIKRTIGGSLGSYGALAYEVRHGGYAAEFDAFTDGIASGVGLNQGDPRLALRNWISRGQGKAKRIPDILQVYVRAWNLYISGGTAVNMKLAPGEAPAKPFLPARSSPLHYQNTPHNSATIGG